MEILLSVLLVLAILGTIPADTWMAHRMGRHYYQAVCRVPMRRADIPLLPLPPASLSHEKRGVVVVASCDGVQVRSSNPKNHLLLRIDGDGRVWAGTQLVMWLVLTAWTACLALMAIAALYQPPQSAALLLVAMAATVGGTGALLWWQAHRLLTATEAALRDWRPAAVRGYASSAEARSSSQVSINFV